MFADKRQPDTQSTASKYVIDRDRSKSSLIIENSGEGVGKNQSDQFDQIIRDAEVKLFGGNIKQRMQNIVDDCHQNNRSDHIVPRYLQLHITSARSKQAGNIKNVYETSNSDPESKDHRQRSLTSNGIAISG